MKACDELQIKHIIFKLLYANTNSIKVYEIAVYFITVNTNIILLQTNIQV